MTTKQPPSEGRTPPEEPYGMARVLVASVYAAKPMQQEPKQASVLKELCHAAVATANRLRQSTSQGPEVLADLRADIEAVGASIEGCEKTGALAPEQVAALRRLHQSLTAALN